VLILDCRRALQEVPPRYPDRALQEVPPRYPDHHYGVHGEPAQH